MFYEKFVARCLPDSRFRSCGNSHQSGPQKVSLLELYTSEGCSSCPPAETWLSRLTTDGRLWKEIVPVAFHVDYWDDLGWKDRYAKQEYTSRQRSYFALGGLVRSTRPVLFSMDGSGKAGLAEIRCRIQTIVRPERWRSKLGTEPPESCTPKIPGQRKLRRTLFLWQWM